VQNIDILAEDKENLPKYDAFLFYGMGLKSPEAGKAVEKFSTEFLGSTEAGIVLLHHSILNYNKWDIWDKITGFKSRSMTWHTNQNIEFSIADTEHPITKGLEPFSLTDETYKMDNPEDSPLIATNHELSLSTIAWTRQYKNSKVFCYASGHDSNSYNDNNFREIVRRGLLWSMGKL
jgi:type 1 glutamine amidotransferase